MRSLGVALCVWLCAAVAQAAPPSVEIDADNTSAFAVAVDYEQFRGTLGYLTIFVDGEPQVSIGLYEYPQSGTILKQLSPPAFSEIRVVLYWFHPESGLEGTEEDTFDVD